jgi:hypothetical protein
VQADRQKVLDDEVSDAFVGVNLGIQPSASTSHWSGGEVDQDLPTLLLGFLECGVRITSPLDLHVMPPNCSVSAGPPGLIAAKGVRKESNDCATHGRRYASNPRPRILRSRFSCVERPAVFGLQTLREDGQICTGAAAGRLSLSFRDRPAFSVFVGSVP